jgi:hypothetical protein
MKYTIRRAGAADLPRVIDLATDMVVHSISPFREIPPDEVQAFRRKDLAALNEAILQPQVGLFVAESDDQHRRFLGHVIIVCG